jgi:hypothetical protein
MLGRLIVPALLAGALMGCARPGSGGSEATVSSRSIDEVLAAHNDSLMALPGVVGTAIGVCDGERCIKVFLAEMDLDTQGRVPKRLEGYRVVTEVSGTVRPR